MRTTIRIDDNILNEAKKAALASNITLSDIVETAIKEFLSQRRPKSKREPVKIITYRGRGLKPGVDLDDSASLLDVMEND